MKSPTSFVSIARCGVIGLLIAVAMLCAACSGSTEAQTRKEQEEYFQQVFRFPAPASMTEIRYKDIYQRHLLDADYVQWMRFSYDKAMFEKIVSERGFRRKNDTAYLVLRDSPGVIWWPQGGPVGVDLYLREQQESGLSSREFLWRDQDLNFVYYLRQYLD